MKRIIQYISLVALLLLTVSSVSSQEILNKIVERGEIRIGMTGDQPPFSMKASNGKLIGYDVDLATLLAASMGVYLKIEQMPFNKLLPALEEGKIDAVISGMTITPERNLKAMFVGPYMVSGKSILTKSDKLAQADETEDIDNIELRLAALKGSTSENFVKNVIQNARVNLVETYDDGIKLLLTDGVDAMVADYAICILAQLKFQEAGLLSLQEPLTIEPIGIALPPNDPLLQNLIENFLNSMLIIGALDELQAYYFDNAGWLKEVDEIKMSNQQSSGPIY